MSAEPPVLPSAEEARRWAAEELAKSEYREAEPGWLDSLWRSFLDWLQSLDGPAGADAPVPSPVIGIVIAVVIAVAVILARPRLNPKARQAKEVFEPDNALTAPDYRQRADASAAAGKWGDAVVDRFRAVVRSAEDRVVLEPQPGRTADEAAFALSRPFPAEAARLDHAARTFDAVRYGNWTPGSQDYAAMKRLDTDLEAARPVRQDAGLDTAALP
ncbi:hypothetical protein QF038_001324 [Pseudarthrobacter sp. W1I19]|uniref:DUF4129 domain-containing protein n=1 Tax=Pseudarthrobacter sp. W1I19 TaxID=3042288 RepID=UPI002784CEB1|nr:DUF4129 domain-containing protein [Pseudarthrobacter sp. W1I19]MDQ0922816.1 hypothetical protein [Pseudarthrobacter sp. W1I19]